MIYGSLATIPERKQSLVMTVESILPQIDQLQIYFNNWEEIPQRYYGHEKIRVVDSQETHFGNQGDAGKFYNCHVLQGYHFTLDDDLIYPQDYVKTYIEKLQEYNHRVIVTAHGRLMQQVPLPSYYRGHIQTFHCRHSLRHDEWVHVGGTGVMAYHTATIDLHHTQFKRPNMADIWLALQAQKQQIPILCLAHPGKWLRLTGKYNKNRTIFRRFRNKDTQQTQAMNSRDQWILYHT